MRRERRPRAGFATLLPGVSRSPRLYYGSPRPCAGNAAGRTQAKACGIKVQYPVRRIIRPEGFQDAARSAGDAQDPAVQGPAHWPFPVRSCRPVVGRTGTPFGPGGVASAPLPHLLERAIQRGERFKTRARNASREREGVCRCKLTMRHQPRPRDCIARPHPPAHYYPASIVNVRRA
jgi:hypothetical protein